MDDLPFVVEDDKDRESEALRIAQSFEHGLSVLLLCLAAALARIIVDVDIDKIVVDDFHDVAVLADEVGKAETPGAPVAADLANNEFIGFGCLSNSGINLCHGIDRLVVDFL